MITKKLQVRVNEEDAVKMNDERTEELRFKELAKQTPVVILDTDEKMMEWLKEEDY